MLTLTCCSNTQRVTPSRGTNSNQGALDETVHGHIKKLLTTEFMENPHIGYNKGFTQFMSDGHSNKQQLLLVVFQHNNKAFAALVKSDQLQDQGIVKKTLTDNIVFNEDSPQVSEDGPPMYVTSLGLHINSNYSISCASNECFSNTPSDNMTKTTNKFLEFKNKTSVTIFTTVMSIEEILVFSTCFPRECIPSIHSFATAHHPISVQGPHEASLKKDHKWSL